MFDFFFALPSELMTAIGTVIGFTYLGDLTTDQQNSLGNFLMLIAQILITDATQQQLLDGAAQEAKLNQMQADIDALRQKINRLQSP